MDTVLSCKDTGNLIGAVSQEVLDVLKLPEDYVHPTDASWYVFCENAGLLQQDDRPEANRILDREGFDAFTNTDVVMSDKHTGAMLCAGFAMLGEEQDESY